MSTPTLSSFGYNDFEIYVFYTISQNLPSRIRFQFPTGLTCLTPCLLSTCPYFFQFPNQLLDSRPCLRAGLWETKTVGDRGRSKVVGVLIIEVC